MGDKALKRSIDEPEDAFQRWDASLMKTKFFIPPARPGHVTRLRLLERLQAIPNYKLIIVYAPAGYGKTTLVSEWARDNGSRVSTAWLSLDAGDNDPIRFWRYFIEAVMALQPTASEMTKSLLHSPEPYPIESILTSLINDLSDCQNDLSVVLDDYHLIKSEAIHSGINFLVEHMPPRLHLVIATRVVPTLPLAHFRGRGTMLEIGPDDLRFTDEEAASLLADVTDAKLMTEDVSALNARTEGWAVGLAIAALSLSKSEDIHRFITTFAGSNRYIMDYLMEEVLRQQPLDMQDFLLKTSVLDRLTDPLCDHLTETSGSREMLARMESIAMGFLIPLDESRQWYRYHHLLADILRHQLEAQSGAEEVAALHRRASQWYEDNGFPDNAVRHAVKARDWERSVCLVGNLAESLMLRGEMATLLEWLNVIPEAALRTNRTLYRRYADALITTGKVDLAEPIVAYLEEIAGEDIDMQGENLVLRANIAWLKADALSSIQLAKRALALLPEQNIRERTRASFLAGQMQFGISLFDEAENSLETAYQGALKLGNRRVAAGALSLLASIFIMRGRVHQGEKMLDQSVEICEGSPAVAMPECVLSQCLYERNELEQAARLQQSAIEQCLASGDYQVLTTGYCYLANTRLAQRDAAGAWEAIKSAEHYAKNRGVSPIFWAQLAGFGSLIAIRQGDTDALAYWSPQLLEYQEAMPSYQMHITPRVLIARGEIAAATKQLQALSAKSVEKNLVWTLLRVRIFQSLIAATSDEALQLLTEALKMGQLQGFYRCFVDEGQQLVPLLHKALQQGTTPEYTARLLNIIGAEEHQRKNDSGFTASASPPRFLSERELEILQLLEAGHSNREISDRMFVTVGTVKVHVHNLMEKLNAQSRTQAVSLARNLKLL